MSKTALLEAVRALDRPRVQEILRKKPALRKYRDEQGLDLLQIVSKRSTADDPDAARRQVRLAQWLVGEGFNPRAVHRTAPGEDGEEEPADVSLAWFAVAKARNTSLARYFLEQGAAPNALFAAAWWGDAAIVADLVRHGANLNEVVGATPLHMAVAVARRGTAGKPALARRRMRVVSEMLRLGADPDIPAHDGTTPLHTAIEKDYPEIFRLLLLAGADPDVPGARAGGKPGRTVREVAARKRDKRYLKALGK